MFACAVMNKDFFCLSEITYIPFPFLFSVFCPTCNTFYANDDVSLYMKWSKTSSGDLGASIPDLKSANILYLLQCRTVILLFLMKTSFHERKH